MNHVKEANARNRHGNFEIVLFLLSDRLELLIYRLSHILNLLREKASLGAALEAVNFTFGDNVDFAQLIKIYKETKGGAGRYSPADCIGTKTKVISGNPDVAHISTSHAERQNLTMRMSMRRFTRLTNAFSKKFENHCHSLALHFVYYNWMRKHKAHGQTPAMAAGLTDKPMLMADLVAILDQREQVALYDRRQGQLSSAN